MSEKDQQIGYHKGALECLLKERAELVKLVQIVSALIHMHNNNLKNLDPNFNLEQYAEAVQVPLTSGGSEIESLVKKNDTKPIHEQDPNFVNFEEHLDKK
jgi:hypothetical protein